MTKIQDLLKIGIFLLILISITYFIASQFYYIDLPAQCLIRIDKNVLNKTNSTKQLLNEISESNPNSYKNICRNIDKIVEIKCADVHPGCYLNGTKTIHLSHNFDHEVRKEGLIRYSYLSKNYNEGNFGLYRFIYRTIDLSIKGYNSY